MVELSNNRLTIQINDKGAELSSIINHENNKEYMWNADSTYWNRHSPVLFPIVGSVWNGVYHIDGKEYSLSQHGFARDMDFQIIEQTENRVVYSLENNTNTENVYPFQFILKISYELIDNTIKVFWSVENKGESAMLFQIGAHPGFYYPDFNKNEELKGYLDIDTTEFKYKQLGEKGCIAENGLKTMKSIDGLYPIYANTFDNQAMIIENNQMSRITLLDQSKNPYLTMRFDAPVVGLWSPPEKNAPFICIEPWYGSCDYIEYNGDFKDKEWMNKLEKGEIFEANYFIDIE